MHKGIIHTIRNTNGLIYTGSSDHEVKLTNLEYTKHHIIKTEHCIKGVDFLKDTGTIAIGANDGSLIEIDETGEGVTLLNSHFAGELNAIDIVDKDFVITSGEDNQIILWDYRDHRAHKISKIDESCTELKPIQMGKYKHLMGRSAMSRCIGINRVNANVAVGVNSGYVQIRESVMNLDHTLHTIKTGNAQIESLKYSTDGKKLAVGTYDFKIYVYDVNSKY